MNALFNIVRIAAYTIVSVTVRKGWNWLTADVDPIPGTKTFNEELHHTKLKYQRLLKAKEEYNEANRQIGRDDS